MTLLREATQPASDCPSQTLSGPCTCADAKHVGDPPQEPPQADVSFGVTPDQREQAQAHLDQLTQGELPQKTEPFSGVEEYYRRYFQQIKSRHHPLGTGGDMAALIAMIEWLWARYTAELR